MAFSVSQSTNEHLLVAAIDFGTTYSGYAFSVLGTGKNILDDIKMNKNWGAHMSYAAYKTPTCVLTGPDGEFVSFGFEAEHEYTTMKKKAEGYNLYRHFKMMLMHEKKLTEHTKLQSTTGNTATALDIFTMALQYLKEHLLEAIKDSQIRSIQNSDIKWVLTVPAIWKDSAKRFMRTACLKAGLISSMDSSQLVIALEPEAASIYCRSVDYTQLKHEGGTKLAFKSGEKYLIIDAGGGTLDISAHEILPTGDVKEIYPPSGGPWGGMIADLAFEQLFNDIFGVDFIKTYKAEQPRDWLKIKLSFEMSKSLIKSDKNNECNISLSWAFGKEIRKYHDKEVDDFIEERTDLGVSFENGAISISSNVAKGLFKSVINDITVHLLDTYGDIAFHYVMLVGGFGQSNLLQKAVAEVFKNKAKVVIPLEAQLAIVKGAVIYGYKPSNIQSRIAKYSYGYNITVPFVNEIHNPKYKDNFGGRELCTDIFKTIIKKGDEIKLNTPIKHTVGSQDYISTNIELYCADSPDVMYASSSEPGVRKHGIITIHHDSSSFLKKKTIEIITEFGGTELVIKARDAECGKWVQTSIDFLN